jgi:hypothetical protein
VADHGAIETLVTDNASIFRSQRLRDFLEQQGIRHVFTAVGHPQTNGLAERTIRSLTDRLSAVIEDGTQDWQTKLGAIALALNSSVQESTKSTPFELVYGRQVVLPGEFGAMPKLINPVLFNNVRAQQRQKQYHDRQRQPAPVFEQGDYVLIQNKMLQPGLSAKLIPHFRGPYRVVQRHIDFGIWCRDVN